MNITELRARIVAARRYHDAAIRKLDAEWKRLAADVKSQPDRADELIAAAADDLGPLISGVTLDDPEAGASRGSVKTKMRSIATGTGRAPT